MPSKTNSKLWSTHLAKHGGVLTLPGDFVIKVDVLGTHEAKKDIATDCLAQYFIEEHRIVLRRSRKLKDRKLDLDHEIQHGLVDWLDFFMRKAKETV